MKEVRETLSLFISAPKFSRESFCSKASPMSSLNVTLTDKRMINCVHSEWLRAKFTRQKRGREIRTIHWTFTSPGKIAWLRFLLFYAQSFYFKLNEWLIDAILFFCPINLRCILLIPIYEIVFNCMRQVNERTNIKFQTVNTEKNKM